MTLSPKDIADFDQAAKAISDQFPALWWSLFKGCVDRGFTEHQAIELVKEYIKSINGVGK